MAWPAVHLILEGDAERVEQGEQKGLLGRRRRGQGNSARVPVIGPAFIGGRIPVALTAACPPISPLALALLGR